MSMITKLDDSFPCKILIINRLYISLYNFKKNQIQITQ